MGFWSNWKDKRKEKKQTEPVETQKSTTKKAKKEPGFASALEEAENQKYHRQVVEDADNQIAKMQQQQIDDLIADPHLHSQGVISPKQGVRILVEEVMDKDNPHLTHSELEKKKKRPSQTN